MKKKRKTMISCVLRRVGSSVKRNKIYKTIFLKNTSRS